jgi:PilZ domain
MICADGSPLGACLMVDVSAGGARLKVQTPEELPGEFTLVLSRDGQLRRQCAIAWRKDGTIGVQFVSPAHRAVKK